jgi:hypothetical protein
LPLIECSAKYNENIRLPFEALIDRIEIQQGDREEPKDVTPPFFLKIPILNSCFFNLANNKHHLFFLLSISVA